MKTPLINHERFLGSTSSKQRLLKRINESLVKTSNVKCHFETIDIREVARANTYTTNPRAYR